MSKCVLLKGGGLTTSHWEAPAAQESSPALEMPAGDSQPQVVSGDTNEQHQQTPLEGVLSEQGPRGTKGTRVWETRLSPTWPHPALWPPLTSESTREALVGFWKWGSFSVDRGCPSLQRSEAASLGERGVPKLGTRGVLPSSTRAFRNTSSPRDPATYGNCPCLPRRLRLSSGERRLSRKGADRSSSADPFSGAFIFLPGTAE